MADLQRIHSKDSVAVALRPVAKGEHLSFEDRTLDVADAIPPGHKIALKDIARGETVFKYGYPIGRAKVPIVRGSHVHTHNLQTMLSESAEYHYDPAAQTEQRKESPPVIEAYKRGDGKIGIRNEIWIIPTVGCVNKTAELLAHWGDAELQSVDGVYAWTHPYGCSQMGEDHETTRRILANLALHPNAGAVLIVGLGCENNTIESFKTLLGDFEPDRIAFMTTQQCDDEIAEGKKLLTRLAAYAASFKREQVDASALIIGMKCGGSDGFSGITANALVGRVCDRLAAMGATAILTEVPEMFGAEQMLMDRCENAQVFEKTVSLIRDFKDYYVKHGQVVYENPSPGNKEGGITTLEDKSCGCVQKGGTAPVRAVYRYGERITSAPQTTAAKQATTAGGLALLEGPGNDIVSTTAMTAAGAQIILFTTGRGTPVGAPVPTIKIASNTALAAKKSSWIDFDAGRMLSEDVEAVCANMLQLLWNTASGKLTKNETNGYREIAIFKNGVTL
ncbi:altronate hydrolase [Spirochaetia bacterium]|nr:altronate hydrolase [Spirochaetia bacterium]